MLQFLGYNFLADGNALDSAPSAISNITTTRLTNAIFDHLNITRNINTPYSTDIPTEWDYDSIVNYEDLLKIRNDCALIKNKIG